MISRRKVEGYVPVTCLVLFLLALIVLAICASDIAEKYSNMLLVALTAVYAYFTYALLRATRLANAPHLSGAIIFVANFKTDTYLAYDASMDKTEEFLRVKQAAEDGANAERNYALISVENTGDSLAINPVLEISFKRKTALEGESDSHKTLSLPDLKASEKFTLLLCVFDQASLNDYLLITKAEIKYSDIGGDIADRALTRYDMRTKLRHIRDESVQVVLKS